MILYLRIHSIFWMITESSLYALITIFPHSVTSVLDSDSSAEAQTAVAITRKKHGFVGSWLLLLQTEQFVCLTVKRGETTKVESDFKKKKKKPSSSAFPRRLGCDPPPSYLTQRLIHSAVILSFNFLFWLLLSRGCHHSNVGVFNVSFFIWCCSVLKRKLGDLICLDWTELNPALHWTVTL